MQSKHAEQGETDADPSSVADKMPTKKTFLFQSFFAITLLFEGTFTQVFIDKKPKRSHKIVEIKVSYFFSCLWKNQDPDPGPYKNDEGPASGMSKKPGSTTLTARVW